MAITTTALFTGKTLTSHPYDLIPSPTYAEILKVQMQGRIQDFRKGGGGGGGGGGGVLINIHEAGEGVWGSAPAANAFLLYHAHNTT